MLCNTIYARCSKHSAHFSGNKRKSQAVIFESVLIFTISIAIFIVCYAVFSVYQYNYFNPIGIRDQLEGVRDYIASHILLLAEKGTANSTIELQVPTSAGPEHYQIILSADGLNLTSLVSGVSKTSPLFGLSSTFILTGRVPSTEGTITLKKRGNQISIS